MTPPPRDTKHKFAKDIVTPYAKTQLAVAKRAEAVIKNKKATAKDTHLFYVHMTNQVNEWQRLLF